MIAAGGTAGHLIPALAVAEALEHRGAHVSFIGAGRGMERELVPGAGYELDLASLRGLQRSMSPETLAFAWSMVRGTVQSSSIIRRRHADAVVGCGGYVSWAPVFAASLMRIPTLIIELDSHMGLANRALAPFVSRVALCFDIPGRTGKKYIRCGRPLGSRFLAATAEEGLRKFGLGGDRPVVLVMGGSLGARSINRACVEAFGDRDLPFQLLHVSGRRDYSEILARIESTSRKQKNYHLLDYTDDMPLAMAAADLIVGRSGASVQEIAALGRPSVLVPYPFATGGHQQRNAEWLAAAGAAVVIPDEELTAARLKSTVEDLLSDNERLRRMGAAATKLVKRDGASVIADEVAGLSLD